MTVAITDTGTPGLKAYIRWVKDAGPDLGFLILSYSAGNMDGLDRCQGIVFTGGGDIHPECYGRKDSAPLLESVDRERDKFELEAIGRGLQKGLPMLGICRGMQLFNVAMGGTLIPDLKTAGFPGHRKGKKGDRVHDVIVEPGTVFHGIVGELTGPVNTSHHQAVERVGEGLRVTARANDGVIEAEEWKDADQRPFLQLVQWHPERMPDPRNPFSRAVVERFVGAVNQKI